MIECLVRQYFLKTSLNLWTVGGIISDLGSAGANCGFTGLFLGNFSTLILDKAEDLTVYKLEGVF